MYVGFNLLIIVPLLLNHDCFKLGNREIVILSVSFAGIIFFLMFCVFYVNYRFYPAVINVELPNLMIASHMSYLFGVFYSVVILCAIFTTAFSCGLNFLLSRKEKNYEWNAMLLCGSAFLFSRLGFSRLLNIFFPCFGILGIVQVIIIIIGNRKV